jgi:hypothetical protein
MKQNQFTGLTPGQLEVLLGEVQRGRRPKKLERRALLAYVLQYKRNDCMYQWNWVQLSKMFRTSKSRLYADLQSLNLNLPKQPRGRYARPKKPVAPKPVSKKPVVAQVPVKPKPEPELTPEQERERLWQARESARREAEQKSRERSVGCSGTPRGGYGYGY